MTFQKKLDNIIQKNNSLVSVGLDSDLSKIPVHLTKQLNSIFSFNKEIIKITSDLVCSYKINTAFYEAEGVWGIEQLKMTCDYLKTNFPQIPIIIDAKRGDIGNTNLGYINFIFNCLKADGLTLHPYLGKEALNPFLKLKDKGFFILCKTSNPGSSEFQNLLVSKKQSCNDCQKSIRFYKFVAKKVVEEWNYNNNCMLVVGATYSKELAEVRKIVGQMTLLVPGIGYQGGDIKKTVKAGLNLKKKGMIINSSRKIIFAGKGKDFAQKARERTKKLRDEINLNS